MGSKYNSIKRLIELWETYEEETEKQELIHFAEWLTTKLEEKPELNIKQTKKRGKSNEPNSVTIFKQMKEPIRFLEYTSRISRFHDFYIKKFFAELPINNRLEYLFLYTVNMQKEAKKTALINTHIVDYTTGIDTIKRLINNGLLDELPDTTDKRTKLLMITENGKKVLEQSEKRFSDEIGMFLACININKWKKTLSVFEDINEFHSDIYNMHNDKTPAELMNLMDSLKHLYR